MLPWRKEKADEANHFISYGSGRRGTGGSHAGHPFSPLFGRRSTQRIAFARKPLSQRASGSSPATPQRTRAPIAGLAPTAQRNTARGAVKRCPKAGKRNDRRPFGG